MELDAVESCQDLWRTPMISSSAVQAVTSKSDDRVPGLSDEAVVAGGVEGVGETGEDALAVVVDGGSFAVHEAPVAFDGAAPGMADALVTEADAEGGEFGAEVLEDVVGDAGFFGGAGSGGDEDVGGFEGFDFSRWRFCRCGGRA